MFVVREHEMLKTMFKQHHCDFVDQYEESRTECIDPKFEYFYDQLLGSTHRCH